MTSLAHSAAPSAPSDAAKAVGPNLEVFDRAEKVLALCEKYDTPPLPSTFALWYAYVADDNDELVTKVDAFLEKDGCLSPYDITELYNTYVRDRDSEDTQQNIGHEFQQEIASVLALIQKSVANNDNFEATLHQVEADIPDQVTPETIRDVVGNLLTENRRMAEHTSQLSTGLRESQKQIEKLNRELEEVQEQSLRDPLTSVANRRAFDVRLESERSTAESNGTGFCLALADIDHFKRVNDTFGHPVGDAVLKRFASILSRNTKGQDLVARYGGEEFAIVLPETDLSAAFQLVDKIRQQMDGSELVLKKTKQTLGRVTASFGICAFEPGLTVEEMIERADQQLYLAKTSGRNMVKAFGLA